MELGGGEGSVEEDRLLLAGGAAEVGGPLKCSARSLGNSIPVNCFLLLLSVFDPLF